MENWEDAPTFGERSADQAWVIRPSAYALIEDGAGLIAIVRSQEGIYLPGGGIEPGETPEQAIRREALEECSLVVRPGGWTARAVQFSWSATDRTHFEKRSTFIACAIEGRDSSLLDANHELLWVDTGDAARLLTHASHGWAVSRWKASISH